MNRYVTLRYVIGISPVSLTDLMFYYCNSVWWGRQIDKAKTDLCSNYSSTYQSIATVTITIIINSCFLFYQFYFPRCLHRLIPGVVTCQPGVVSAEVPLAPVPSFNIQPRVSGALESINMLVVLQLSQSEADYNEPAEPESHNIKLGAFQLSWEAAKGSEGRGEERREELILFMSLFSQDLSGQEKTFMGI